MKRGSFLLPFGKRGNLHLPFVFPLNPFSTLTRRQRVLPKAARFIYNPHVGISAGAVTTNDRDAGMRAQPDGEGLRRAVGQQINRAVAFEVDDDATVATPAPSAPIVDADDARRCRHGRVGVNEAQQRHATHANTLVRRQSCTRFPAKRADDALERCAHVVRPPPVDGDKPRQPLTEDLALAGFDRAGEAPRLDPQRHRHVAPWEVCDRPCVRRMHRLGALLAEWAGGCGADGRDGERDTVFADLYVIEAQTFEMGQNVGGVEVHERTPWLGHQTARAVSPHTLPLTPNHQMWA